MLAAVPYWWEAAVPQRLPKRTPQRRCDVLM
jgi:hypothetical protein